MPAGKLRRLPGANLGVQQPCCPVEQPSLHDHSSWSQTFVAAWLRGEAAVVVHLPERVCLVEQRGVLIPMHMDALAGQQSWGSGIPHET